MYLIYICKTFSVVTHNLKGGQDLFLYNLDIQFYVGLHPWRLKVKVIKPKNRKRRYFIIQKLRHPANVFILIVTIIRKKGATKNKHF